MEYKTEFGKNKKLANILKIGDLFRWANFFMPNVLTDGGRYVSLHDGRLCMVDNEREVVRIRIDRVEDGLPVFVDA